MKPVAELTTRYYLRMEVADRPGVLAQIARCFGDHGVSIASVIQKETRRGGPDGGAGDHDPPGAGGGSCRRTMKEVAELPVVSRIGNLLRVES